MPNWCFNCITINYDDSERLENLYNLIEEWTSKEYMESDYGTDWFGNIVLGSGVGSIDLNTDRGLFCRGRLDNIELFPDSLIISTESAWQPCIKMWLKIIEKYLSGATLTYVAEMDDDGEYVTNNPDLIDKYIFDAYDNDDYKSDWEMKEDELIKTLQEMLGEKDDLLNRFYESEFSNGISIHKWEYENEWELN